MTPENGSTEVWLRTQNGGLWEQEEEHGQRASGRIKGKLVEVRRKGGGAPVQPTVKKGSVVVRDLRLWHGESFFLFFRRIRWW
jgi:hypothetical protein